MSQFDFPRINFHGHVWLDTPTANNGYYQPLTLFDQERSEAYMPPRLYFDQDNQQAVSAAKDLGLILHPAPGDQYYITIDPINDNNYQEWATTPIGEFDADKAFIPLYLAAKKGNFKPGIVPGYWNYWGDVSLRPIDVGVTGVTIPDATQGTITYTPSEPGNCPPSLLPLLNADFTMQAYMCDLDSIGQLLTQIFWGPTGLVDQDGKNLIIGKPVKSSTRWMNLKRVINSSNIVPTGGSASFFSMIDLSEGTISRELSESLGEYIGSDLIHAMFMKINIHQVYEVRNPDYTKLPSNEVEEYYRDNVPRNPCKIAISGSLSPYKTGDMKTGTISRMLKTNNHTGAGLSTGLIDLTKLKTWSSYSGQISQLIRDQKEGADVPINSKVDLANVQILHNETYNIVSLDLINALNEYGIVASDAKYPATSAGGDVKPFSKFENCNYGKFILYFVPDSGSQQVLGSFNWKNDYNMAQFLANGGMVDISVPGGVDYSNGVFKLALEGFVHPIDQSDTVMIEDESWLISDQSGTYCEEGQEGGPYLSQKLPYEPCVIRAFQRGIPIPESNPVSFYWQDPNSGQPPQKVQIFDGLKVNYAKDYGISGAGCYSFGYVSDENYSVGNTNLNYFMLASINALRVLANEDELKPYVNREKKITWDVVYEHILREYKTMLPIMDRVKNINEKNWSDPTLLNHLLAMINESSWQYVNYMPVTRGLTNNQRKILELWAEQCLSNTNRDEA